MTVTQNYGNIISSTPILSADPNVKEDVMTDQQKITILYCRLSNEDSQDGESNSIQNQRVLSRVMRKYNSVTYEVGKAKAEQAAGMFGLAAGQRTVSCPSRVAKPLAKPLTGGWRSATYARSQSSAPCFSRSICSSDFMLM